MPKTSYRYSSKTETFLGDMVFAMKDHFKEIYSIELSEELHNRAKSAFKKYPSIHLGAGDSATALESVFGDIKEHSLFWLDGHYLGELPFWEILDVRFVQRLKRFSGIRSRTTSVSRVRNAGFR